MRPSTVALGTARGPGLSVRVGGCYTCVTDDAVVGVP